MIVTPEDMAIALSRLRRNLGQTEKELLRTVLIGRYMALAAMSGQEMAHEESYGRRMQLMELHDMIVTDDPVARMEQA